MNKLSLVTLSLVAYVFGSIHAAEPAAPAPAKPAEAKPAAPAFKASDFVGIWEHKDTMEQGSMTGYTVVDKDGTATAVAKFEMQGQVGWATFAFTWKLDGDKLVQTITKVSIPILQVGQVTTDTVVSIDAKAYRYRSDKSDKITQDNRVAALPPEFAEKLKESAGK